MNDQIKFLTYSVLVGVMFTVVSTATVLFILNNVDLKQDEREKVQSYTLMGVGAAGVLAGVGFFKFCTNRIAHQNDEELAPLIKKPGH